ncbi:MAG: 16S rRNA processing protein RimM [Eubacteriaceae bacterium]|nr:16S rRNA processing protein RimM [Eubacteriaceae bacterium]
MRETLEIGKITGAHGIAGEITIFPITDDPERLLKLKYFLVDGRRYEVDSARPHKGTLLVKCPEITDRTSAEKLKGKYAEVFREDASPLKEGEYYIEDLIGMRIIDEAAGKEGKVINILSPGAADVLEYESDGDKYLMAMVKENICEINTEESYIKADFGAGVKE